jgi:hypothetical protein
MQGREDEDMYLGELDLDGIEHAFSNMTSGNIPTQQINLLREEIIKTKVTQSLRVIM